MPRNNAWLLVPFLLCGCGGGTPSRLDQAGPVADRETGPVEIRIRPVPAEGKSMTVNLSLTDNTVNEHVAADGTVLESTPNYRGTEEIWTETVLQGGDRLPMRFQRDYQKSRVDYKAKVKGKDDQGRFPRSYEGRTILYHYAKLASGFERYDVSVKGEPLTDPDDLMYTHSRTPNGPDYLTPAAPVRVGAAYVIDPGQGLPDSAGLDKEKSKGEGQLIKTYTLDGKKYGVIEVRLKQVFAQGNTIESEIHFDGVIDGSSTAGTLTSTIKSVFANDLPNGSKSVVRSTYGMKMTRSAEK